MSLYMLEKILDNPKYEGFGFVSSTSLRGKRSLMSDFMPDNLKTAGRRWTAPSLIQSWVPQEVGGRVRAFNDFPCVGLSIPAFSRRAVDALRDFLEPNGELLPLVSDVGEYFVYNATTVADVLDHDRSELEWHEGDEVRVVPLSISRYECVAEKLAGLLIFRLVEAPSSVFVTQPFVDRVREHSLEGFNFKKVW